jgi:hypothetical protein
MPILSLPPRSYQFLAPRVIPPRVDAFVEHIDLRMLDRSPLAPRKSQRINRSSGPREKIIGRELANRTRRSASAARTHHPPMAPHHDRTPLPLELTPGYHEVRMEILTSCMVVL